MEENSLSVVARHGVDRGGASHGGDQAEDEPRGLDTRPRRTTNGGPRTNPRRKSEERHGYFAEHSPDAPDPQFGAIADRTNEQVRAANLEVAERTLNWRERCIIWRTCSAKAKPFRTRNRWGNKPSPCFSAIQSGRHPSDNMRWPYSSRC